MQILRFLHSSRRLMLPVSVEKSVLAKLRKSTGYSFSKCKEALQKHENDLKQAEHWLKAEAQAHGWEKATKLQGRSTGQGLISILSNSSSAVILEVNCETDFVARNKKFQGLVQKIVQGCHQFTTEQHSGAILTKLPLTGDAVGNLPLEGQRPVKDEVALGIGDLGENIKTRRAVCLLSNGSILLAGYTHPTPETPLGQEVAHFGRYGALVALRPTGGEVLDDAARKSLRLIGRQLCQHIVGMNPKEIGSMEEVPPRKVVPEVESIAETAATSPPASEGQVSSSSTSEDQVSSTSLDAEFVSAPPEEVEEALVNQDFLLDADMSVREFLLQNSVEVLDFVRFECGETIEATYCQ